MGYSFYEERRTNMKTGKSTSERFSGLAKSYSKSRPGYPKNAIDFVLEACQLGAGSIVADIGCGTGISTRLFAQEGIHAIGIDPNQDMMDHARQDDTECDGTIEYKNGSGENTGMPDESVDLVVCAQAFHWFKPQDALSEFARILKKDGHCALLWNERNEKDKATAAYGDVVVKYSTDPALELKRGASGKDLILSDLFQTVAVKEFSNSQALDLDSLLGRAFSTSYMPHEGEALEKAQSEIKEVFASHSKEGIFTLSYVTTVYLSRKK